MYWFNKKSREILFSGWITQHHDALFKHALWMTGNGDLAADMVQETFYQAWLCIEGLRDHKKALSWLLTILRRAIHKEQRFKYRQLETLAQISALDEKQSQDDCYGLLQIYSALEQISPVQRDTFLLHHLHGFKYAEISEILNIPVGTVMSRLARAREALEKLEKTTSNNVIHLPDIQRDQINDR